ncbi:50S ribosomal protein L6, partial [Geodia barretti]
SVPDGVTVRSPRVRSRCGGPRVRSGSRFPTGILFEEAGKQLSAQPAQPSDRSSSKFHGLARSLVANAVHGVSQGFTKELDIVGIGYRAEVSASQVVFHLGYSHPVPFAIPDGIQIAVDKQNHITVAGIDRQRVGQVAADIRALRKPDPYKQKGIRYTGEVLKKKVGKTGA